MFKSCCYCGRVHPRGYICPKKPRKASGSFGSVVKFRRTRAWIRKSIEIKCRDGWCCVACYNVQRYPELIDLGEKKMNYKALETHHIKKLCNDKEFEFALDNDFLITLCKNHHKLADAGLIDEKLLEKLARENNEKPMIDNEKDDTGGDSLG